MPVSRHARRSLLRLALTLALFVPTVASAWVETTVRSHHARVIVGPDAKGEVRQELVIKLRGGPLPALELDGFAQGMEVLPDASVSRVEQGATGLLAALTPTPSPAGGLRLDIALDRGLRGGNYLFQFGHGVSFRDVGWLESRGDDVLVTFVGPRLPTGVDAARVTFVVPHGTYPPRLPEQASGPAAGILVHQLRQGADSDELELVRAHLAVAEPATWQILVARDAFGLTSPATLPAPQGPVPVVERALRRGGFSWSQVLGAVGVALAFAALAWAKGLTVNRAAAVRGARPRPLVPGAPWLRALLTGVAAGGAIVAAWQHRPGWAAALALGACLPLTFLLPVRGTAPRGPGAWKKLDLGESLPVERLPGRLLDAATLPGCLLFGLAWLVAGGLAYRALASSTYVALLVVLLALVLVPLFWTGRQSDLPQLPVVQGRHWLRYLERKLGVPGVQLELWGRVPTGLGLQDAEHAPELPPDEVRVRLVPQKIENGLRALEVVLEEGPGAFVVPCALVRVLEDSEAARRLSPRLPWQRGRSSEEKVALVRPSLPVPRALVALLRQLCLQLATPRPSQRSAKADASGRAPGLSGSAIPAN
ncbi:MAG TPA: hypothetical protein VLC09_02030 [Polyangiaceae bacterium]|nr:hypothetical protein [Polyangiaceae bacterium]